MPSQLTPSPLPDTAEGLFVPLTNQHSIPTEVLVGCIDERELSLWRPKFG